MDGRNLLGLPLNNKEIQDILTGLDLKKSGSKKELVDRILGREVNEKKKPKWKNRHEHCLLKCWWMKIPMYTK